MTFSVCENVERLDSSKKEKTFCTTGCIFPLLGKKMLKDVSKVAMSRVEKFSLDVYPMPLGMREP